MVEIDKQIGLGKILVCCIGAAWVSLLSVSPSRAHLITTSDKWVENFFFPILPGSGLNGSILLRKPNLGEKSEAEQTYQDFQRRQPTLLPGVWYRAPEAPTTFSLAQAADFLRDVPFDELARAHPELAIAMWEAKYVEWVKLVAPGGDWDIKLTVKPSDSLRLEYEDAGNFYFGATGVLVGNPNWFINFGAGAVNQFQALMRGNVAPYYGTWMIAFGDDPVDFVYSGMGQDYVTSGQYIWDYFLSERFRYSEDLTYGGTDRPYDNRVNSYDEADRRIYELGLSADPEIQKRNADELERRLRRIKERHDAEMRKEAMLRRMAEEERHRIEQEEQAREKAEEERLRREKEAQQQGADEAQREERSQRDSESRRRREEANRQSSQEEWQRQQREMERHDREAQAAPSLGPSSSPTVYGVPGSSSGGNGVDVGGPGVEVGPLN